MEVIDKLKSKNIKVTEVDKWGPYFRKRWEDSFAGHMSYDEKKAIYLYDDDGACGFLFILILAIAYYIYSNFGGGSGNSTSTNNFLNGTSSVSGYVDKGEYPVDTTVSELARAKGPF